MKECQEQVCSTSEPEPRLRTQSKRVLTRDQVKYVTFGLFEGISLQAVHNALQSLFTLHLSV